MRFRLTRPLVRPSVRPFVRRLANPAVRPLVRPLANAAVRPLVRPLANPALRPFLRRRRTPLAATSPFLLFLLGACAKIEAPSGGPLDKDPPFLVRTFPDSAAVQVPPVDTLVIVFSEPMDQSSVELALRISPPVEFRAREWEDRTWRLQLSEPFAPNTTYSVLLGAEARDRRKNLVGVTRSFAFSTGESLDAGRIEGKVIGQRFSAKKLWVYTWPWESAPPDTTVEGPPPAALRLGQTDDQGAFAIGYVPLHEPLRVCAFYDRDGDGEFQPLPDRWACFADSVVVPDSALVRGVELFVAAPDEPALVQGTVVDSVCAAPAYRDLYRRGQARRDSILEWLEGELQSRRRGQGRMTLADSARIETELAAIAEIETAAKGESLLCAQPVVVRLFSDTTTVREAREAGFQWDDVPPGIYRLRAFRDVNLNGRPDPGEAQGTYPFAIETAPLRKLEGLEIPIAVPEGVEPLLPSSCLETLCPDRMLAAGAAPPTGSAYLFPIFPADARAPAPRRIPRESMSENTAAASLGRDASDKGVKRCAWNPTSNGPELRAASGWPIGGRCG